MSIFTNQNTDSTISPPPTICEQHPFLPGEIRCPVCGAHRHDCDCPQCEPASSTSCPEWCTAVHTELRDADGIVHDTYVGDPVKLSNGSKASVMLSCEETAHGLEPVYAALFGHDGDDLTTGDLSSLIRLLVTARGRLTLLSDRTTAAAGCPAWCRSVEADHQWSSETGEDYLSRFHRREVGLWSLAQEERSYPDGRRDWCSFDVSDNLQGFDSAADALGLATGLGLVAAIITTAEASSTRPTLNTSPYGAQR